MLNIVRRQTHDIFFQGGKAELKANMGTGITLWRVLEDPVQLAVVGLGFRAWRFTAVYGYYLWGPTIVARVLSVPVGQAARYFVYVAGGAVVGKILVSLIAPLIGRRDSDGGTGRCRGEGGIVTRRVTGKDSLDVLLDFAGIRHRRRIDGE